MKSISAPIILAGLLIPVAAVYAQPDDGGGEGGKKPPAGEGRGPRGDGPRMHGFGKGWKDGDKDNSGTLSREEFNELPRIQRIPEEKRSKIFSRLDKNQDGILDAEELKMMTRPPHEGGREAMRKFRELDTDKSGGVSLAELKAGELFKKLPPEKQEALFARLDTDKDGEITIKDRPPGPPDGPGRPGREDRPDRKGRGEHPGGEGPPGKEGRPDRPPRDPRRMLKDQDENQDGSISFGEFRKSPPVRDLDEDAQEDRFEALDKNGDKKLDETDFPSLPRRPDDKPAPNDGEQGKEGATKDSPEVPKGE